MDLTLLKTLTSLSTVWPRKCFIWCWNQRINECYSPFSISIRYHIILSVTFLPCAEVLGVGSGSRLTRVTGGSGVSVPFSVGSSLLVDDNPEEPVVAELLAAELAPTLLADEVPALLPLLMLLLPPLTSLWKSNPIFISIISGEPWTRSTPEQDCKSWLPISPIGVSDEPLSFLGLPRFLLGAVSAEPSNGWLDMWWNLFCATWWWCGPIWLIRWRLGGGGATAFWLPPSSEDVMLGKSHLSSFTSVRPFILRDSATRRKAVNRSWSTLTSPRYIKSKRLRMSTYGTSLRMTIGCLSGWPTNKACKRYNG